MTYQNKSDIITDSQPVVSIYLKACCIIKETYIVYEDDMIDVKQWALFCVTLDKPNNLQIIAELREMLIVVPFLVQ